MEIEKSIRSKVVRSYKAYSSEWEPVLAEAFIKTVKNIRSEATLQRLSRAIESNDANAVIDLIGPDVIAEALKDKDGLTDAMYQTYVAGGEMGREQLPKGAALEANLKLDTPEATKYLRENLPMAIVEITEDQRAAIQSVLVAGNVSKQTVAEIARDLRDTIGLTDAQAQYVRNFREQLETGEGGDPSYRRLNAVSQNRASAEYAAEETTQSTVDDLVDEYYQSMVNYRAEAIARTECHDALVQGQRDMWDSAAEDGLIDGNSARRFWSDTEDDRERDEHLAVPDMNPDGVGLDEPFDTPVGPVMDPGTSGDPAFDIQCRCCVILQFV